MGQKKKADSRPFPTVSVFSYGQINPTVKIPRLGCTQFVVPLEVEGIKVVTKRKRETNELNEIKRKLKYSYTKGKKVLAKELQTFSFLF